MGYKLNLENMNLALNKLKKTYKIYAPKVFEGQELFQIQIELDMEKFQL